jgi:hypothetical protein
MVSFISAVIFGICAFRAAYWETKATTLRAALRWLYWHVGGMFFLAVVTSYALHYALTGPGTLWIGFAISMVALGYMFGRLFVVMDVVEELDGNPML